MTKRTFFLLFSFVFILLTSQVSLSKAVAIQDSVYALDLSGNRVSPSNYAKNAVFVFFLHDCPICNSYVPELNRLESEYSAKGIHFILVYEDDDFSVERANKHHTEYGISMTAIFDSSHAWAKSLGVTVAPEVVVFDQEWYVYRGTIDDGHPQLGVMKPESIHHDLKNVLDAMIAGKPVTEEGHKLVGCFLESAK